MPSIPSPTDSVVVSSSRSEKMAAQILRDDPKTLRTCILYEFFRKKSILKTFQNFCEVMGPDAVEYQEFEFWFHRFAKGNFDLNGETDSEAKALERFDLPSNALEMNVEWVEPKEQILKKMPILPMDPPIVIRWFIMHDVLLEKPVFDGFKDMCKIDPQFDYSEYDYWYYRFLAENLDVSYNRSADPKPRKLEELPVEVLFAILEPFDVKQRFEIRQVSKKMLSIIDQLKTNYFFIYINREENFEFFVSTEDSIGPKRMLQQKWSEESAGENFVEIALRYLEIFMKPTKIQVTHFTFGKFESDHLEPIVDWLVAISTTAKAKFHVKFAEIRIGDYNMALSILSILKPGVLQRFCITNNKAGYKDQLIDMSQMKEMEQFKQARNVELIPLGVIQSADLWNFTNFKQFYVRVQSLEPEDVKRLRDELSKPENSNFQRCEIQLQIPFENIADIGRVLGEDIPYEETPDQINTRVIVNSEKVLDFCIKNDGIEIDDHDSKWDDDDYDFI